MAETLTPRLMAAAKEFNIGKDTLVEFLAGKGFDRDDLKPTSKLTEDMYRSLQQEFQGDKVAKIKSDQIDLPKGNTDAKRKKEEEEIAFKKEVKKVAPATVSQPPVAEQPPAEQPKIIEPVEAPPAPVVVEHHEPAPPAPAPAPVVAEQQPEKKEQPDVVKVNAPEIGGPKVLAKIDLSAIDSSTRPKKVVKKKEEEEPEAEPVVAKAQPQVSEPEVVKQPEVTPRKEEPKVEEKAPEVKPAKEEAKPAPVAEPVQEKAPAPAPVEEQKPVVEDDGGSEAGPVIENIKADKLEGPKVLGKIQLPIDSNTRPKPNDEKRKRKRIPIDKKGDQPQQRPPHQGGHPGQQHGGGHHQGGQGQGQFNRPRPQFGGPNQQQGGPGNRQGGQQGGQGGGFRGNDRRGPGGPGQHPQRGGNQQRPPIRREDKEINQKEIQDKIRQTQAKLAGSSGRGKSLKAKYRREKRQEQAEMSGAENMQDNKLQVTEFISVSELASLMDVSYAEVIGKCMGLGMMVSINQRLDAEVIELVASEFGYDVEFIGIDDAAEMEEEEVVDSAEELQPRSPIVTIMGHVDHGKTSLLDYIRSANVVAGESGGITQHIGAYQVDLPNGKQITFLDTPGHEAFTAMRARGAKATDIAVIVIAADDAVMPQTKEAISHAQAAGVPMIFAINKIDKDGANSQKIYEQLAGMNLLVESWGGKYQSQELSAKKGLNVDQLLEKILLEAELLELKANPNREATGTIIEATLDKGRGYVATVLVHNGTLRQGDLVVSGQNYGRVKAMFNERNKREDVAPPSTPVLILGLNGAPQAGEKFKVFEDESEAKEVATRRAQILREQGIRTKKHITLDEIGRRLALGNFKELNLIIKGDVDGSVEALSDSLQKLSTEEVAVRVVHKAVGQITESDVLLATASDAIVVGFNVRASSQASRLAENEGVEIKTYSIIYNIIDEVKSAMEGMLEPKIQEKEVATVEVREVYKFDKATVAGCLVTDGKIKRDSKIRLFRDGVLIYPRQEGGFAELGSLKRYKDDVKDVANNTECGLTVKGFADIQVGDTIVAIEVEEVKRTL
ncbi:translation initiation factor IF-2 [Pinibacter aurantiacus]|nr:translation initiation factor IF-2 [Pinibacter aurantiacus]